MTIDWAVCMTGDWALALTFWPAGNTVAQAVGMVMTGDWKASKTLDWAIGLTVYWNVGWITVNWAVGSTVHQVIKCKVCGLVDHWGNAGCTWTFFTKHFIQELIKI